MKQRTVCLAIAVLTFGATADADVSRELQQAFRGLKVVEKVELREAKPAASGVKSSFHLDLTVNALYGAEPGSLDRLELLRRFVAAGLDVDPATVLVRVVGGDGAVRERFLLAGVEPVVRRASGVEIALSEERVVGVAVSPGEDLVAGILEGSAGRELAVWDRRSGAEKWRVSVKASVLAFGSKGSLVAVDGEGVLREIAGNRGEIRSVSELKVGLYGPLSIAPGGRYLAGLSESGELLVVDLSSMQIQSRLSGAGAVRSLAIDSEGVRVVALSTSGTVRWWDLRRGTESVLLRRAPAAQALALSSDGGRMVLAGATGHVTVWDVDRAELVDRFTLSWSPSAVGLAGDAVACGGEAGLLTWSLER